MGNVDLGFAEECESEWLSNRYFPSKLGGKPAWLDLSNLPSSETLQCVQCKTPKSFLCQLYAPYDDEHNFHRSIYIFICRTAACQQPNSACNLTVLRSQLSRKNDFYSEQAPAEDGKALPAITGKQKLCIACGCLGPLCCGRCKSVNYCSAQHQRAHWSQHKAVCASEAQSTVEKSVNLATIVFPEWEICIEDNEEENETNADEALESAELEQLRLTEFEQLAAAGNAGTLQEVEASDLEKYAQSAVVHEDKQFDKFKQTVQHNSQQIIRYKRNGTPLWITDVTKTVAAQLQHIPNCENCGAARQFEFQIMPQMLLLLKDEQLDWGVLVVYTCSKSCATNTEKPYLPEYIIKQDLVMNEQN